MHSASTPPADRPRAFPWCSRTRLCIGHWRRGRPTTRYPLVQPYCDVIWAVTTGTGHMYHRRSHWGVAAMYHGRSRRGTIQIYHVRAWRGTVQIERGSAPPRPPKVNYDGNRTCYIPTGSRRDCPW